MRNTRYSPENDLQFTHDGLLFWNENGEARMLHIERDPEPTNPRDEEDNLAIMACFHTRHSLGDDLDRKIGHGTDTIGGFWDQLLRKHIKNRDLLELIRSRKIPGVAELAEEEGVPLGDAEKILSLVHGAIDDGRVQFAMSALEDKLCWLPMYLYDHSGLTVSCSERKHRHAGHWDSSEIGWIVLSKEKAMSELGAGENDWREKAEACMEAEVRAYNDYLTGNVWMYALYGCDRPVGENEYASEDGLSDEEAWGDAYLASCGGFNRGYLFASGMADSVGHGLAKALSSGDYYTGIAKPQEITVWTYVRHV